MPDSLPTHREVEQPMTPGETRIVAELHDMVALARSLRERCERIVGEVVAIERETPALKRAMRSVINELPEREA